MARTPKCTPKRHRFLAARRKTEARYVKKHPGAAAKAAAKYYKKHHKKISHRRALLRTPEHLKAVQEARRKYGGTRGRPRTC